MENKIENKFKYNCLLRKINHKPLIINYIVSFIKGEPYKFLNLIEKDHLLKDSLNKAFSTAKKKNDFSKELNDNIQLVKIFKNFKETCRYLKDNDIKLYNVNEFDNYVVTNNIDPSFIIYKSNNFLRQIQDDKNIAKPSIHSLSEICFYEMEKYKCIHLCYFPEKYKYLDGLYIQKNLNNANKLNTTCNKVIDILYCIIDDNQYYLDNIRVIKKDIIINEIYFIYIKGIKEIDIKEAIEKYLYLFNKNNIKKITLGQGFFKETNNILKNENDEEYFEKIEKIPIIEKINDILINHKIFNFGKKISVKLNFNSFDGNILKLYLGIYILFKNENIEGFKEIDITAIHSNDSEEINEPNKNILVIKINSISEITVMETIKKINKLKYEYIIFYVKEKSKQITNKNNIEKEITIPSDLIKKKFIIYAETPNEKCNITKNFNGDAFQVTDINDKLILFEYNYLFEKELILHKNWMISYLFLLKKFKFENICFKYDYSRFYFPKSISYKIYFIKKNKIYDIILVFLDSKVKNISGLIKLSHNNYIFLEFEKFINYSQDYLNIKINDIKYMSFPFRLENDLCKNKDNDKEKNKNKGQKGFALKLNEKQMIENELEDENYSDEEYEDENYDYNSDGY